MSSNAIKISSDNFKTEVIESKLPVLADFAAEWCGPCKRLAPIVDEIASEMKDKVKVVSVDIDENQELAAEYNIMSVPTLILFKNGAEANRNAGLVSKTTLVDFINKNI